MADVLVIQNSKIEGIGTLGNLLESDGYRLQTIYAKQQQIPEGDFSFLIILGASESANDNLPYLIEEQKLIKNFVTNKIPVLGICLGSQLIAKALGAKVYTGHKKEIGFYDDLVLDGNSKLFSGITSPMTVFHWHGDTFSLPDKSVRLAHSQNYENQAFQIESAIGVQFHLEVDKAIVNLWLDKAQEKLKEISYVDPNIIRKEVDEKISIVQNNMEIFYKNFKSTFHF